MNNELKKIIKIIKKYDKIIITGHKNPDFDSFSSSLGMFEICKKYGKEAYIYISLDKARSQSIEYGHSYLRELSFLVIHGFLHLLGYDHMNEEDEKIMFKLQEDILDGYGIKR